MSSEDEKSMKKSVNITAMEENKDKKKKITKRKEQLPKKNEVPMKGENTNIDNNDEYQAQQNNIINDDGNKKGKKQTKNDNKQEFSKKQDVSQKGKKKNNESDEDETKKSEQQNYNQEDYKKGIAKNTQKEGPPKIKENINKGKKNHDECEYEDEKQIKQLESDYENDNKKGKKISSIKVAQKEEEQPVKKVSKKGAPKKKKEESEDQEMEENKIEEFQVDQFSSKKANNKVKKDLEHNKKKQTSQKCQFQVKESKKSTNNQFATVMSDSETEEEEQNFKSETNQMKCIQKEKVEKKKANMFDFSSSEEEEEEDNDIKDVDEEEIQRETVKKEEERKKKDEQEKKKREEEEKKKAVAEKKRLQQEAKKKKEEEDLAVLLASINQNQNQTEDLNKKVSKAEDNQDEEGGKDMEEGEKKLSKTQLKKIKGNEKKLAQDEGQEDKKKKIPIKKAAIAAQERLAQKAREKIELERLNEEQKIRDQIQKLKDEEDAKIKANEKKIERENKIKMKQIQKQQEIDKKNKKIRDELINQKGVSQSQQIQQDSQKFEQHDIIKTAPAIKNPTNDSPNQTIQQNEIKEKENKLDFQFNDWESYVFESTTVSEPLQKNSLKEQESDGNQQEEVKQEEDICKNENMSKKDINEQKKAQKDAEKAMRNEQIQQGQKKKKIVEEKNEIHRSPIVCILGHVDTGKTTLLDKLRRTNVQGGEAGGITQQIGATYFPKENIITETNKCQEHYPVEIKAPGLLVIDTPGHESFSNLRTRGSSLCDFAILVIDLMHGIEQQTLESINLLKMRKTPFVIAMNKIDRSYSWKSKKFGSSFLSLQEQSRETNNDFQHRFQKVITQLAENSINAALYWDNPDPKTYFPIVPTSGVTGEGIPDLLSVIIKYTSMYMKSKMIVKEEQFNCTVMEVKKIDGLGVTIDAILVDGTIRQDDKIVLLGFNGPIKTKVRSLLTPHPMKEMRVKGEYEHHQVIHASMGIKISAPDLDSAVAGSQLYLANTQEEEEKAIDLINNDLDMIQKKFKLVNIGVGVATSTLGSLEALLNFLDKSNIPVSYVSVGPVSKDNITKALKSVLADDPTKRKKEYACMLVFDVKVLPDAQKYAEDNGVKIFTANIIYHLFDYYMKFVKDCQDERRSEEGKAAIFPCVIKPIQFFNKADPIIMGVDVERGTLKPGTPVCIYNSTQLKVGVVESIELNKKNIPFARKETGSVAIRIKGSGNIMAGRQFTEKDKLVSMISRTSIDALKNHYRDDVSNDEWIFIKNELKPFFNIL